jgi:glycolate oxidase FAD binding subunit
VTAIAVGSVGAVRDRIAEASERGMPLRVVGRGAWLDAGRPVRATEIVSTRDLSGITQYVPGDLTLTALSGTTMGEIRAATAEHGQWLALDPYGSDDGTIGATVATGSAGPLFTSFGRARDLVLGLEFVTGTGLVARGGGRVVKNVAGFDLTRLLTGSWGSLGVITEITVRLHARPEADETIAVAIDAADGLQRTRALLRRLPFVPYACEVLNDELSARLVGADNIIALVRIGGNKEALQTQRTAFAELGEARPFDANVWQWLRATEPRDAIVFRLSQTPSRIDETWTRAMAVADACTGTLIHASPIRGVVRCIVPNASGQAASCVRDAFAASSSVNRIGERLPADLWPLCSPPPTADVLSSRIKHTFDPNAILNPGIFGEPA